MAVLTTQRRAVPEGSAYVADRRRARRRRLLSFVGTHAIALASENGIENEIARGGPDSPMVFRRHGLAIAIEDMRHGGGVLQACLEQRTPRGGPGARHVDPVSGHDCVHVGDMAELGSP